MLLLLSCTQGVRHASTSRAVRVNVSCAVEPKKILMMGEQQQQQLNR
jgi:hypothetical protein